jgi:predicted enzyme related to lactoylglutathione lyase
VGRVVHFEIHAADMDRAERFYTSVFGWSVRRSPAGERDYRLLTTGADGLPGINGALLERRGDPAPPDAPVSAFVCTVAVEDLAETDRRITESGGACVVDRREVEGVGSVAYFRDPEGNVLGCIEPQR